MPVLYDGIDFVPVRIGLFAISELRTQSQAGNVVMERIRKVALKFPSREDFRKCRATIARSSVIGTFIGILPARSEEHTSELQSLMRISYAVFCLKKKTLETTHQQNYTTKIQYRNHVYQPLKQ